MSAIPLRPMGTQGLIAPQQGFGLMGLSGTYDLAEDKVTDEEGLAVIEHAYKLGINFLDSADVYGAGHNERLVAKVLAGRRDKFVVCSKFGNVFADGKRGVRGDAAYVRSAVEASLARLQTDYIDLYYQHRVDRSVPIEETWGELKKLVEEGKVRYLGISEATADEIRRAHAVHPITAVQLEWSLWTRTAEAEVIPTARELGIAIVPYAPLGRGFLAGKLTDSTKMTSTDRRQTIPRFSDPDNFARNVEKVRQFTAMAEARAVTASQLALAWVHSQGDDVFPIPGTKRIPYLEQNVAALSLKLSDEEKQEMEALFSEVAGDRFDESGMKHAFESGKAAKASVVEQ